MAIPDFQSIMLPLLKLAAGSPELLLSDAIERLAEQFRLSDEDQAQMLPSGRQRTFDNRVGWARTHLSKAGLLEIVGRGRFEITPRGREVVQSPPPRIDIKFLNQFPEFHEFRRSSRRTVIEQSGAEPLEIPDEQTPDEILDNAYGALIDILANELLDKLKSSSPALFEHVVVDLMEKMGYGVGQVTGRSGDGGIDGLISQDKLGLDVVYLQAKRWGDTVGSRTVREFAGALDGHRATKGVLMATAKFARDALDYVRHIPKKIVLVDGDRLVRLMIDHEIGVAALGSPYKRYRVNLDYFEET